jgi:hypothetical protein
MLSSTGLMEATSNEVWAKTNPLINKITHKARIIDMLFLVGDSVAHGQQCDQVEVLF